MGSGTLRNTQTHTHTHTLTERVLRALAEVRTGGGVCGEAGAGAFRGLSKRDAICVYSAIMSREQQQQVPQLGIHRNPFPHQTLNILGHRPIQVK